jgi:hypothetical protein
MKWVSTNPSLGAESHHVASAFLYLAAGDGPNAAAAG